MAEGDASGIRITNREVYDQLVQVRERLLALEGRVDAVLTDNVTIKKEYGGRLRALELRYYAVLAGLLATLTGLGVAVGGSL